MSDFFDLLREQPAFFISMATLLGLMVGSFLNVVIHRLPKMMEQEWERNCAELHGQEAPTKARYTLVTPRSACPACGHPIKPWENIPVISYLLLGGKCSACKVPISPRYPLVEGLTGLLAA